MKLVCVYAPEVLFGRFLCLCIVLTLIYTCSWLERQAKGFTQVVWPAPGSEDPKVRNQSWEDQADKDALLSAWLLCCLF